MRFLADLHIHSKYSRATSPQCNLAGLHAWAQRKGVAVVGTGDFTHPAWFAELRDQLTETAPGIHALKGKNSAAVAESVRATLVSPRFLLTGEISSIYKRDGKCRKIHSLIATPTLDAAEKINKRLAAIGNIHSDGRPILGLDPRNLLEIILEAHPASVLIPAHIWTPWFAMLGSKSGFDSPVECFGDLAPHIFAVETGLSSDPPMNWRVPALDGLRLVSNSDLHSPSNLARNANVFFGEPDYYKMFDGLRHGDETVCGGTLDLFPEEGKYFLDGHRACGVCMTPQESIAHDCVCPVCRKPLTLGVLHRVEELADPKRAPGTRPAHALPFCHFIPLPELVAECLGVASVASKKVVTAYDALLAKFGPEMHILFDLPPEDLATSAPIVPNLDEALRRMRRGDVHRTGGYDGVYGRITVFKNNEQK